MVRKKYYFIFPLCILLGFLLISKFPFTATNTKSRDDAFKRYDDNKPKINYLDESDNHVMWFVQVSDLHISVFHDLNRISDLEYFFKEVLSFIRPKVIIASGDLTDAKNKDLTGSKQYEFEWKTYNRIIKESKLLEYSKWLDVRGNHDNFDVPSRKDDLNYFKKYGIMSDRVGSYMYDLETDSGDKYSFIAVDACSDPGPRRPFNFFGRLLDQDIELLSKYSKMSEHSNGTIWFGHYPTSTILSPSRLRNIMTNGVAYLCGHLHTLGGLMYSMYSRHTNGLLELELADWKVNRKFRILAFDAGLLSFKDFSLGELNKKERDVFILITNPKSILFKTGHNREPLNRIRYSSHIRLLIFSKDPINNVQIFINEISVGFATQVKSDSPLFTLKWNPKEYLEGLHKIKVVVKDSFDNIHLSSQEFSLDDSIKSFKFFQTFIIRGDQITLTRAVFFITLSSILLILIFFRFNRRRFTVGFVSCGPIRTFIIGYLRRFALLSSIDYVYYTLIVTSIYVAFGPWFVGEMLENSFGVCFSWGMYLNGTWLNVDFQYLAATFHLILFHMLLMLHLSNLIEKRFLTMHFHEESRSFMCTNLNDTDINPSIPNSRIFAAFKYLILSVVHFIWFNFSFIVLTLFALLSIYDLFLSYSMIAVVVCPIKTWMLVIAIYLRFKCLSLNIKDFNKFIDTSKYRQSNIIHYNNQKTIVDSSIEQTVLLPQTVETDMKIN